MTFEIELDGKTRAVSVERLKSGVNELRITIDGEARVIDAARLGGGALSLVVPGGGPAHYVSIAEGTAPGELTLAFPGATVQATVNGRRARRGGEAATAAGEQRILAPMPGRVLRVLVAPGADVAARQPLVVVEAMKMENELSSPKAGVVKDVLVAEGQSVEAGRLLIIVE